MHLICFEMYASEWRNRLIQNELSSTNSLRSNCIVTMQFSLKCILRSSASVNKSKFIDQIMPLKRLTSNASYLHGYNGEKKKIAKPNDFPNVMQNALFLFHSRMWPSSNFMQSLLWMDASLQMDAVKSKPCYLGQQR